MLPKVLGQGRDGRALKQFAQDLNGSVCLTHAAYIHYISIGPHHQQRFPQRFAEQSRFPDYDIIQNNAK